MAPGADFRVVGRALVGIFTVGEVEHLLEARDQPVGERVSVHEPPRDRSLVGSRDRERLGCELAPRLERELAVVPQLVQHPFVLGATADGRDVGEVLRRGAKHCRAADVDHLDRVLLADAVPGDRLAERVEVDADQVERLDLLLLERGEIFWTVAPGQNRRVDSRVERLDAAAEQLGHLRDLLDPRHRNLHLLEVGARAAAGDDLDAELDQALGELVQARLVVDRDQGALDHAEATGELSLPSRKRRTALGRSRYSTSWIRACSVSTVSPSRTSTASCSTIGPVSMPSSTKCTVAPVTLTPCVSASSTACAPGNAGSSDG